MSKADIAQLIESSGFRAELAQIRTKAVLTEITGEAPQYKWTYSATRVVRNLIYGLHQIEQLSRESSSEVADIASTAIEYARAWESVSKLGEKADRDAAIINSSALYELGGYQANALCLARQLYRGERGKHATDFLQLCARFLQRLFVQVRVEGARFAKEPLVDSEGELMEAASTALAATGLVEASKFLLTGKELFMTEAQGRLEIAGDGFAELGLVREANVVLTLRSLLPIMRDRSIWLTVKSVLPNNSQWERYLKLLARGAGRDLYRSPSVSELWPSQLKAVQQGLLQTGAAASKVVRMPTSAGKTRIAELSMVHALVSETKSKCIYVAPFRALVTELQQQFLQLFADLGYRVSSVLGGYETDDFEQILMEDADVLVLTPEKLDLLFRLKPDYFAQVRLVILDEGHILNDHRRGIKLELLVTRLREKLPEARFLFMSAVVPQHVLEEFAAWLGAQQNGIIETGWRPSIQRFATFRWAGDTGVVHYAKQDDVEELGGQFVPGVIHHRIFEHIYPGTGKIRRPRFPDKSNKSQIAAELAYKYSELGPVLVFCPQRNFVESVGSALVRRLELATLTKEAIPSRFISPDTRSTKIAEEWLGMDHPITHGLRSGIALHHGALPDILRKSIEADFREGNYRVLVATNTLAQGVNLPIRTVVIQSCWRSDGENRLRIPARDYWNIAGRAGRAGHETEGTIIHIVLNESDANDVSLMLSQRASFDGGNSALFQLLQDLVAQRISPQAASEILNPEILATLVEESSTDDALSALNSVLDKTLASRQAANQHVNFTPLRTVCHDVGNSILSRVAEAQRRLVYSTTGLRSESCEHLRGYTEERQSEVLALFKTANTNDMRALAQFFIEACIQIPEMSPEWSFDGNYLELLSRWLDGVEIQALRSEFGNGESEELPKFIEDLFGYKLPWGIASLIRIASMQLGLVADDCSQHVKFFPSMVKFGVPSPEASWAMTLGIPIRQLANRLASDYRTTHEAGNYSDFLEWMGGLDNEVLSTTYGLRTPLLEDVARALSYSNRNPFLSAQIRGDFTFPITVDIQGANYPERREIARLVRVNDSLDLMRDYDNTVDRNAISGIWEQKEIGYLPRALAQMLAPQMDAGDQFDAVVTSVSHEPYVQISVKISAIDSFPNESQK